jgi:hypothetical protein
MLYGYEAKRVVVRRDAGLPCVSFGGVLDENKQPTLVLQLTPRAARWQDTMTAVSRVELRRRSVQVDFVPAPILTFGSAPLSGVDTKDSSLTNLYLTFKISDKRHLELASALGEIFADGDVLFVNDQLAF